MSTERAFELDAVRTDGWFERVISGVPALARLCETLGEPLVALGLAAGFRITSASIDRMTGELAQLQWLTDSPTGEVQGQGDANTLRTEVLAALLSDPDDIPGVLPAQPSPEQLRLAVGARALLLAPLFGLLLRRLLVADEAEPRVLVAHNGVEELVPLRQLRRFLRARVVELLQTARPKGGNTLDLSQLPLAQKAFDQGRYEDVLEQLSSWLGPLSVFHRTAEGAALEPSTRAELALALVLIANSLQRLSRTDEGEEVLRLAAQYAHDNAAAPRVYESLAQLLVARGRHAEALGPWRRVLTLDPEHPTVRVELARCYVLAGRAVAGLGMVQLAREHGSPEDMLSPIESLLNSALGYEVLARYRSAAGTPGFEAVSTMRSSGSTADTDPPPSNAG